VARARVAEFSAELRGKLLAVDDTQQALQQLALAVRRAWGGCLAGVTGSVGKTTTKEILAALLAARFRVLKSEGNLNNEYGLPLTLLRLEPQDEAAVVELGMSHLGEIRRLAAIAEPNIGVVTSVAPVHLEFFSSVDEIAVTKRELIEGLRGPQSCAVLNADDYRVAAFALVAPGRVLRYGFGPDAEFRAEAVEDRGAEGTTFEFVSPAGRAQLELALVGRHNISNALGALAAASIWGVGAAEAAEVFPRLRAAAMRGEVLYFADGFAVIDDCYNSNPVAVAPEQESVRRGPGGPGRPAGDVARLSAAHLGRR
jgi:UDP-N-acetylmuramoyl-tripeptide--D-alanyl-D-alanine ligase